MLRLKPYKFNGNTTLDWKFNFPWAKIKLHSWFEVNIGFKANSLKNVSSRQRISYLQRKEVSSSLSTLEIQTFILLVKEKHYKKVHIEWFIWKFHIWNHWKNDSSEKSKKEAKKNTNCFFCLTHKHLKIKFCLLNNISILFLQLLTLKFEIIPCLLLKSLCFVVSKIIKERNKNNRKTNCAFFVNFIFLLIK